MPAVAAPAAAAIARSPDTQASRECAQRRSSSSQMPASGSCQRFSIASAATAAARQSSVAEHVVPGRGGEQRQRLAERVELELLAHPVTASGAAAGKAAQPQRPLAADRL